MSHKTILKKKNFSHIFSPCITNQHTFCMYSTAFIILINNTINYNPNCVLNAEKLVMITASMGSPTDGGNMVILNYNSFMYLTGHNGH